MSDTAIDGYRYGSAELNHSHDYLPPDRAGRGLGTGQ